MQRGRDKKKKISFPREQMRQEREKMMEKNIFKEESIEGEEKYYLQI